MVGRDKLCLKIFRQLDEIPTHHDSRPGPFHLRPPLARVRGKFIASPQPTRP